MTNGIIPMIGGVNIWWLAGYHSSAICKSTGVHSASINLKDWNGKL